MEKYYIIPENIATQKHEVRDNLGLSFRRLTDSRYVINVGCGEDSFPEIPWGEFEIIELSQNDFPKPKLPFIKQ